MILLSPDGKTLVSIESWDDVFERPGFIQSLDPKEYKLHEILGIYSLSPKMKCGLSNCRTEHNRGYLIKTTNGYETNIGNVCGKKHFDVDFTIARNTFKRETNAQRFRENLFSFSSSLMKYRSKIANLYEEEKGANWCYKEMHWYFTKGFESRISEALIRREKSNEPQVTMATRMTKDELELANQTGNRNRKEQFKYSELFIIAGLNSVKTYKRINTSLKESLVEKLNLFNEDEINNYSHSELRRWNNWTKTIETKIKTLEDIVTDCRRFLVNENIHKIKLNRTHL